MTISKSLYDIFNYGSLLAVALLAVLMFAHIAPQESYNYLIYAAILLLAMRIFIRVYYFIQNKKNNNGG